MTVRADAAFYSRAFVTACRKHGAAFSVTVNKNSAIRRAIDTIPDDASIPIPYWLDGGADVAETTYTAFKGTKDALELRLIVRRALPTHRAAMNRVLDALTNAGRTSPTQSASTSMTRVTNPIWRVAQQRDPARIEGR